MEETALFCENGQCRVMMFTARKVTGEPSQNCPGCGEFGRAQGK